MSAYTSLFGDFGRLFRRLLSGLQITVQFGLSPGDQVVVSLLIVLVDSAPGIIKLPGGGHFGLRQIKSRPGEPAHRTWGFLRRLGFYLVQLGIGLLGLIQHGLCLILQKEHLDIGFTLFNKDIIPLGNRLVIAEGLPVCAVQLVDLVLLLLFRARELFQAGDKVVDFETVLHHLCPSVLFDFQHLLYGDFKLFHAFLGTEQAFGPLYDFIAVHDQQHDACRQGGLPREQGGEDLFPYRHALLPGFHQIVIFDPRPFYLVRENGQVVGDGEEKHLGPHSQRGHLPSDLLDTHVQAVELLLGGGQFRGDCPCGFRSCIQLF